MERFYLILILCSMLYGPGWAQQPNLSNLHYRKVAVAAPASMLDTLTVLPESVSIFPKEGGAPLQAHYFMLANNRLILSDSLRQTGIDTVLVRYRTLPFNLSEPVSRLDTSVIRQALASPDPFLYGTGNEDIATLDFGGVDYNGSFSRGLSFGNNQSLVLNSNFNMQIAGTIGDDIELLASITDSNLPIQPEGNTQQLNEFDKVFIQLSKDNHRLIAGDYELQRPPGYFMNYFKKLQGATYENTLALSEKTLLHTRASVAATRGRFARNTFPGQEGNQGPYRLSGAEGERFIIVLAGTEKVYIDGILLKRGQEQDYVIDYNRGDITFTPNRLITKDIRIIVEFEYNVQRYLRSLYAVNSTLESGKWNVQLNLYSEQDGRRAVGEEQLTPAEQEVLANAGDDPLQAVIPAIDTAANSSDPIKYRLIDTLVNGITYTDVLVYSPKPVEGETLYTARFSEVGAGNGNYIRPASDANGIIYQWVAPDPVAGPQGSYAPVRRLIAPTQQQLYTLGASYRFSERTMLKGEVALSNYDLNRFSSLDQKDDLGLASFLEVQHTEPLGKFGRIGTQMQYEFTQQAFEDLNPYRRPEFVRDWNLQNAPEATEHIGRGTVFFANDSLGLSVNYKLNTINRSVGYQGWKQVGNLTLDKNGWEADLTLNLLQNEDPMGSGRFSRPKGLIAKRFDKLGGWRLGVYGEREKNSIQLQNTDTLDISSFYYDLFRVFLESPRQKNLEFGLFFTGRDDFFPDGDDFSLLTRAREVRLTGKWSIRQNSNLNWNLQYRRLMIKDSTRTSLDPNETYLGRIDYNLQAWKGLLRYTSTYQLGSGQEQKLLFIYRPVLDGAGLYQHIDFNEDGIEQNNEFVIAPTPDLGTHERIVIYTNEFIRTNNVQLNQNLQLDPRTVWYEADGIRAFLARFSTASSWQVVRNVRDLEGVSGWNPFELEITDTALVSTRQIIQNSLFFNRGNPNFDVQLTFSNNQNKLLLSTGLEGRRNREQSLRVRWNLGSTFTLLTLLSRGNRLSEAENFADRNYDIQFFKANPQLTWLPQPTFRLILAYRYEDAQNVFPQASEKGVFHDFKLESTFRRASSTSLRGSLSYVNVDFSGDVNSPVGFAFLNGLQNGSNFIWNISLDQQLSKNVRLGISYEGRKTGMARVVHVGRAQVGAVF